MEQLRHVTSQTEWMGAETQGGYAPPPGGFIHLCRAEQLPFVLERHFAGRTGLLVLHVDPAGLDIRWEESEPGMAPFPHLYGRLPANSVRRVEPA